MDYVTLILVVLGGVALGYYFARRRGGFAEEQSLKKEANKESVVAFLRENGKATNDDIEKLLAVSDATATRYFAELEEERRVHQVGTTGRSVYYVLK